jgi:TonB-linked SusC/RagA family outer membrane protein
MTFFTYKVNKPSGFLRKFMLVMKLTIVLLIAAIMQVSASTYAQKVTLQKNNASLLSIFSEIRIQTGYDFIGDANLIRQAKPINIHVKDAPLNEVLKQCFEGQDLTYTIEEKTVVVKKKQITFIDKINTLIPPPPIIITGRVTNVKGEPLVGVSIFILGTNKGVITDAEGYFKIQITLSDKTLIFSSVGMKKQEVAINGRTVIKVVMEEELSSLDEVQVIGYGITTKRLSTGSVGKVKASEIEQQPVSNPMLAMEGKVPGLFITQSAGFSGAKVSVLIRGQNSLNSSSTDPLYIIDGIPFGSTSVEKSIGSFSNGATIGLDPLNTINPANIESITVLKDADATAIYGSRGANGVILITTKKGQSGNTKFNFELNSGFGQVTHTIPMLSAGQYLSIRRQAFANDGVTPTVANAPDLTLWDQNANTNFPKLLVGNTSHKTNAAFSMSGGDAYTQFLFGGNYRHETTVFDATTADNAVQFNLNLQHKSHDNKFGATFSVNYNLDNNTIPNYSLTISNYSLSPNYPIYNSNGSLYFGTGYTNPLAAFNIVNTLKSANLIANTGFHLTLLPGLVFKTNLGYNLINVEGSTLTPLSSANPLSNPTPMISLQTNYIKTYIAEPQLNYTYILGKGKLTALIGGSWQETQTVQPYFIIGTYTNINLANSLGALTELIKSSGYTDYRYVSGFGRLEYEWDSKYLFSANIRRDGSSRFGANRQFGTFGSGAAAWIFSRENFVKDNLSWLSFGKIKTSYGTIGNDKIPDYQYEATYGTTGSSYGTLSGLTPSRISNPYLQWEVTKKFDAAIDLGFLKDRVFFSADFYLNRTNNLLGNTPMPSQDGFGSYVTNLPATVQNKGLELELTTTNVKNKNLSWSTSFNLTVPQNELVSFPGLAASTYASSDVVGQSLNVRHVYHSTGIINGIATAQDLNKDGVLNSSDYVIDGNSDPKLYGGLNNTITYKGFQLDILFQFIERTAVRGDLSFASSYPGTSYNLPVSMLDLPLKYSAKAGSAAINAYQYYTKSDAAIEDASFVRLKNVSLAYNMPSNWAKQIKMVSLQVYIHGQNLLTITKYKGQDPETMGTSLPPLKMLIIGIKTTF